MHSQDRRRPYRWGREFYTLAKPYFTSEDQWLAVGLLMAIAFSVVAAVYSTIRLNSWYQEFYDVAASLKPSDYYLSFLHYIGIFAAWIAAARAGSYLRYRLQIRWREWMTRRFLSLWIADQRHYFLQLTQDQMDNPDQRIAEDVELFIRLSLSLTFDLLDHALTLISFLAILWSLSPNLVLGSVVFALASNALVYLIGKALVPLEYSQQHREADFRFALMRIRENSESIALARGEEAEIHNAQDLFSQVVSNFRAMIRKFVQVEVFQNVHLQVRWLFPWFMAARQFLSGAVKLGGMMQIVNSFEKVEAR